jgi:hypothetical protein
MPTLNISVKPIYPTNQSTSYFVQATQLNEYGKYIKNKIQELSNDVIVYVTNQR